MPRKRNSAEPPPVMTWGRALPVLSIALVFDALRLLFSFFWFFGPALAGVYCSYTVGGGTAGGLLCGAAVAVGGSLIAGPLITFGVVMSMATALFGWLTLVLLILLTNVRLVRENASHSLWLILSLALSETPLIGAIPAFFATMFKMHYTQIKNDRRALAQYNREQEEERLVERRQQVGALMQAQAIQQVQEGSRAAANDERYLQENAANDERYGSREIPESERLAA